MNVDLVSRNRTEQKVPGFGRSTTGGPEARGFRHRRLGNQCASETRDAYARFGNLVLEKRALAGAAAGVDQLTQAFKGNGLLTRQTRLVPTVRVLVSEEPKTRAELTFVLILPFVVSESGPMHVRGHQ